MINGRPRMPSGAGPARQAGPTLLETKYGFRHKALGRIVGLPGQEFLGHVAMVGRAPQARGSWLAADCSGRIDWLEPPTSGRDAGLLSAAYFPRGRASAADAAVDDALRQSG